MSAFKNNPWVMKDKQKKDDEDKMPEKKSNPRKKVVNKNPFGNSKDASEEKTVRFMLTVDKKTCSS